MQSGFGGVQTAGAEIAHYWLSERDVEGKVGA
jgi:hypothetical protein